MVAGGRQRTGAEIAFWGSTVVLPLDVLTTLGARRAIDDTILEDFKARRIHA